MDRRKDGQREGGKEGWTEGGKGGREGGGREVESDEQRGKAQREREKEG